MDDLKKAIDAAVREALAVVGLQGLKQTSMFISSRKRAKVKQAA
jgi:hypothetical protein